ncbi:hypothetical protein [Acinetobacter bereziniae]|uniref:hypothetical protein n=1 Tax=Acinetobacter bereziniae TaxID=106648 RepID=UPI00300B0875
MTQPVINFPAWVALYSDDTALSKGYIYRQGSITVSDLLKRQLIDAFPMVMAPLGQAVYRMMPIDMYYAVAITQSFEPKNVRREHYRTLIILINQLNDTIPNTLINYFKWLELEIKNFGPHLINQPITDMPCYSEKTSLISQEQSTLLKWVLMHLFLEESNNYNILFDSSEITSELWPQELSLLWEKLPIKLRFQIYCSWFNEANEYRIENTENYNKISITYLPMHQINSNWKRILKNYPSKIRKFNDFNTYPEILNKKNNTLLFFLNILNNPNQDNVYLLNLFREINLPIEKLKDFFWLLEQTIFINSQISEPFKTFYKISIKLENWVSNNYLSGEARQSFLLAIENIIYIKQKLNINDSSFVFILPPPLTNALLKDKIINFWAKSFKDGIPFSLEKLNRSSNESSLILNKSINIAINESLPINLLISILKTLSSNSGKIDNRILWLEITKPIADSLFKFSLTDGSKQAICHVEKIQHWLTEETSNLPIEWKKIVWILLVYLPHDINQFSELIKNWPSHSDANHVNTTQQIWTHWRNEIGASIFAQIFLRSDRLDLLSLVKNDNNLIIALLDEPPSDTLIKIYTQQTNFDPDLKYPPQNWLNLCIWLVQKSALSSLDKKLFFNALEPFKLHFGEFPSQIRQGIEDASDIYMTRTLSFLWEVPYPIVLHSIEPELRDRLITKPSNNISTHFENWILACIEHKILNNQQIFQVRKNILPIASNSFHQKFSDLVSKKFPKFLKSILKSIEEILHLSSNNNKRPELLIADQILIQQHGSLADKVYLAGNNHTELKKIRSTYKERCDFLTSLLSEIIHQRGSVEVWWKLTGQKPKNFPDKDTVSGVWYVINETIYNGTISYSKALQASWDVLQQNRNTFIKDQRRTPYSQLARLDLYHSLID